MALDPAGKTVLELGCGRGSLLLGLTQAGVARATGIDLSPVSIDAAREQFRLASLSDRADLAVGDAAHVSLTQHDWVILDRVLCCYPDVQRLMTNAISATTDIFAFTVPTSRGWRGVVARLAWRLENAWMSSAVGHVRAMFTIWR